MLTYFDRKWFRGELLKTSTIEGYIILLEELIQRLEILVADESFKNLCEPDQVKVGDQYKTSIDVCWEKTKALITQQIQCEENEKVFYNSKNNKPKTKEKNNLFNKELFLDELVKVNNKNGYLKLILKQLERMNEVFQQVEYENLHVLEQRRVKDRYVSSMVKCWYELNNLLLDEHQFLSQTKKRTKKREHVMERRARHAKKGIKKAEFKDEKKKHIDYMLNLPEEDFLAEQAKLEREYRLLRNLPEVPEV